MYQFCYIYIRKKNLSAITINWILDIITFARVLNNDALWIIFEFYDRDEQYTSFEI